MSASELEAYYPDTNDYRPHLHFHPRKLLESKAFDLASASFPSLPTSDHISPQNFASKRFLCLHTGQVTEGAAVKADLAFTKTTSPILSISLNDKKNSSSSPNSITNAILPSSDQARSLVTPNFLASASITSLPTTSSLRFHCTKPKIPTGLLIKASFGYLGLFQVFEGE